MTYFSLFGINKQVQTCLAANLDYTCSYRGSS